MPAACFTPTTQIQYAQRTTNQTETAHIHAGLRSRIISEMREPLSLKAFRWLDILLCYQIVYCLRELFCRFDLIRSPAKNVDIYLWLFARDAAVTYHSSGFCLQYIDIGKTRVVYVPATILLQSFAYSSRTDGTLYKFPISSTQLTYLVRGKVGGSSSDCATRMKSLNSSTQSQTMASYDILTFLMPRSSQSPNLDLLQKCLVLEQITWTVRQNLYL